MRPSYSYVNCKTALSPSRLPGLTYSLNPYMGCEHGCLYCYARGIFRNEEVAVNWGKSVMAKRNIVEVLRSELQKKARGVVGLSTVTDPYQPLEAKLHLSRGCIEALLSHEFPVSIQTKSALILRDLDILDDENVDVGVTITTLDKELAREMEPRASAPDALAYVLGELRARGIRRWLFLGPIIPEVNDGEEQVARVVEVARKTESVMIYDKLNLRPWVLSSINGLLQDLKPGLGERLPPLLARNSTYWRELRARIERLCREVGVKCAPAFPPTD